MEPEKKAEPGNTESRSTGRDKGSKTKSSIFSQKPLIGGPGDGIFSRLGYVLPIAALVAVAILAGWFFYSSGNDDSKKGEVVKPVTKETFAQVSTDLDAQAYRGDIEGALRRYEDLVDATDDVKMRRHLVLKQASLALKSDKPEKAIEILKEIENEHKDQGVYYLMAAAYEKQGRNMEAADYYDKAAGSESGRNMGAAKYRKKAEELRKK